MHAWTRHVGRAHRNGCCSPVWCSRDTSTDAAVQFEVPLSASFRVASGFAVGLGVGFGVVGVAWDHVAGTEIVWARPVFRFAAAATLGWVWGWS